jgi:Cu(I)/Ag(I) efflux system membrane protein CusA/SilA
MLNRIIRFSLNNRLLILATSILLLIAGCYTAWHMDVDVFPDLNAPTVVIMTEASGMASEEVEQLVTFPIETAVNGATDVRRVRSSSTTGFSVVWVEFDWGTDIYRARQIVSEKLAAATESLPEGVGRPTMGPQSSILGEVLFIGLTSDSTSLLDLRTLADWTIRPQLLAMGGVAQVSVLGGDVKEYQILIHPERMRHCGVSLTEVMTATEGMNQGASGGVLYEYGNEYIIRGLLATSDTEQMKKAVVRSDAKGTVLLGDVAEVKIGGKSPKTGVASIAGHPGVLLTVTKQPDVSTLELTQRLDEALATMQNALPAGVEMHTDIYRQQNFIDSSIGNIQESLVEGIIFVVLVLFIFLMNARTTLISLVSIPLALLVTILTLRFMGLTLNTMSIGGMAIAIGSLVDDAVVDVENVFKRLRANRQLPTGERKKVIDVVFHASREVRMPILNSTLIIVVSFVPLFFLSGMEGRMLAPLGIAFIVSLFASTAVALTLTPVLCSYLLGTNKELKDASEPWVVRHLKHGYDRTLAVVMKRRRWVLGALAVLIVGTLALFATLGHSFLPPFNEGSFTINVSSMPGISLEESDRIGHQAEELLLSVPEIRTVARKTGRAELDEHALGVNTSEIEAPFTLDKRSKEEVIAEVRRKLNTLPGVNVEIGQPISHRLDAMLSGTRANIAIKLFGTDLNHMYAIGNQIKAAIADVPGVADLNVEQQIERPQLKIVPRRELLARYGITLPEFGAYIRVLLGGDVVSQVYEGNQAFDLTVRVNDPSRDGIEAIGNLMVDTPSGEKVPLADIAEIRSSSGPNTIGRENVARKLVVSANVADRDLRSVVDDIQREVAAKVTLPDGYRIEYGGQFESEQSASRTLGLASAISILVILMLLYQQFHDIRQSVVILFNLPLALIGGVLALACTGGVVSIPAIIGFISLFGIATRNGMLLIDRYNELRREGLTLPEAIRQGSLDRLNPIIMTALTSALALIPLAVGSDLPGNEIQSPMAQVMLGGLLSSTLLNAYIIPVMYLLTERARKQKGAPSIEKLDENL